MPGPQVYASYPFTVCIAGRGLDPSAAARGLAALQASAKGMRRGRDLSLPGRVRQPRGVEDAAPYQFIFPINGGTLYV